jgi:hypothetical protein
MERDIAIGARTAKAEERKEPTPATWNANIEK